MTQYKGFAKPPRDNVHYQKVRLNDGTMCQSWVTDATTQRHIDRDWAMNNLLQEHHFKALGDVAKNNLPERGFVGVFPSKKAR